MCEYCESKKFIQIAEYDNSSSRPIYDGQYGGVGVEVAVSMKGNALSIEAFGSYRSERSCYYESQGLDIEDDASSEMTAPKLIKIDFCPFCGRDLRQDKSYKTELARVKLPTLKKEKKELENLLKVTKIIVSAWKKIPAIRKEYRPLNATSAYDNVDIIEGGEVSYDFSVMCPDMVCRSHSYKRYIETYDICHRRGEDAYYDVYNTGEGESYPKFSDKAFESSFTGTGSWSFRNNRLEVPSLMFTLEDEDILKFEKEYGIKIPVSRIKRMQKVRKEIMKDLADVTDEIEDLTVI